MSPYLVKLVEKAREVALFVDKSTNKVTNLIISEPEKPRPLDEVLEPLNDVLIPLNDILPLYEEGEDELDSGRKVKLIKKPVLLSLGETLKPIAKFLAPLSEAYVIKKGAELAVKGITNISDYLASRGGMGAATVAAAGKKLASSSLPIPIVGVAKIGISRNPSLITAGAAVLTFSVVGGKVAKRAAGHAYNYCANSYSKCDGVASAVESLHSTTSRCGY